MLKKSTILKFTRVFIGIVLAVATASACSAKCLENSYEEIIKKDETGLSPQESTVPEALSATQTKPVASAEKLKDDYMKDILQKIEEKKKVNKEKDILFIGNSLTEGMRITIETENDFICKSGVSLDGLELAGIETMEFKVVVINMGTNELGVYDEEHFKTSYRALIESIKDVNSDSRIICCSIPPISDNNDYSPHYNNENTKLYSTYIQEIANEYNLEYLDNEEFFGEDLKSDWTEDGLHFSWDIYVAWYNFLIEKI